MNRSRLVPCILSLLGLVAAGGTVGTALATDWTLSTIDATGDVGKYADLQMDASGNLHIVYLRSDNGTLKIMSKTAGVWGTPRVIDSSGQVAGDCSVAPAGTELPVAYRRSDLGAAYYAGPARIRSWTFENATSGESDDVGTSMATMWGPGGQLAIACRNVTDGSLVHLTRETTGAWSMVVVDPGPSRGQYCDLTYRPGVGYAFSEYASVGGSALLADRSIRQRSWTFETPTSGESDDVGTSMSTMWGPGGQLALACRNVTDGSLVHLIRETTGAWSTAVVDPGPSRGEYCDLTYRPGVGYAFSEYNGTLGAALLADPALRAREWTFRLVDAADEVGSQLECTNGRDGRTDCVYLNRNPASGVVDLRAIDIMPDSSCVSSLVAGSVAADLTGAVQPSIFVSPGPRWHVAFRNDVVDTLYYASALWNGVDITATPESDPGGPAPAEMAASLAVGPNPSLGPLRVTYSAPRAGRALLRVFDAGGRCVREVESACSAGNNHVLFDGRDDRGGALSGGVYFMSLSIDGRSLGSRKLSVLR
jgi:hypothetical protein